MTNATATPDRFNMAIPPLTDATLIVATSSAPRMGSNLLRSAATNRCYRTNVSIDLMALAW